MTLTDQAIVANYPHRSQNIPCSAYYVKIQETCLGGPYSLGKKVFSKVNEQISSFKILHMIFCV